MTITESLLLCLYFALLIPLAIFGLHRYYLLYLYHRHARSAPAPPPALTDFPHVTVQLPIYNERYVVGRLIDAVAALDYPKDKLEIQVLDDSTDETSRIAETKVAEHRCRGIAIHYLHRDDRAGFKAGALEAGLREAKGDLIAIFDADFIPPPEFLRQSVPHFHDTHVGMVQARWSHLNADYSVLSEVQAMLLDGHFVIEHAARHRSGRFFNFNGTAGVWRRAAIEQAGGWEHDTLTEDLDLSYRAQLMGWRFVYLPHLTAPSELPIMVSGFKSQQHRWTKGAIQTGLKLLPRIWRSPFSLKVKLEATVHLTNNLSYLLMFLLSIMMLPAVLIRAKCGLFDQFWADLFFLGSATVSVGAFYIASQRELGRGFFRPLLYLPALMAVGIGLSVNNSRAVLEALFGVRSDFVRTAKFSVQGANGDWRDKLYRASKSWVPWVELFLAGYYVVIIAYCVAHSIYVTLPFMLLFFSGFAYMAVMSFLETNAPVRLARRQAA